MRMKLMAPHGCPMAGHTPAVTAAPLPVTQLISDEVLHQAFARGFLLSEACEPLGAAVPLLDEVADDGWDATAEGVVTLRVMNG